MWPSRQMGPNTTTRHTKPPPQSSRPEPNHHCPSRPGSQTFGCENLMLMFFQSLFKLLMMSQSIVFVSRFVQVGLLYLRLASGFCDKKMPGVDSMWMCKEKTTVCVSWHLC